MSRILRGGYLSVANLLRNIAKIVVIDLKFRMGSRICTFFLCVRFGCDPISSLDFSFTEVGGAPYIGYTVPIS